MAGNLPAMSGRTAVPPFAGSSLDGKLRTPHAEMSLFNLCCFHHPVQLGLWTEKITHLHWLELVDAVGTSFFGRELGHALRHQGGEHHGRRPCARGRYG